MYWRTETAGRGCLFFPLLFLPTADYLLLTADYLLPTAFYISRPTATATLRHSAIICLKAAGVSAWKPSLSAFSGSG